MENTYLTPEKALKPLDKKNSTLWKSAETYAEIDDDKVVSHARNNDFITLSIQIGTEPLPPTPKCTQNRVRIMTCSISLIVVFLVIGIECTILFYMSTKSKSKNLKC
jgi:hypothetical protein